MAHTVERREALRQLAAFLLASPLLADTKKPELTDSTQLANVFDFRELARKLIDPVAFDYMDEGGKDEISLVENRLAFRRIILRPKFLTDVHDIDVSTELLGIEMDSPVYVCPAGGKNCFRPGGEEETARGAALANAMYISNGGIEDYLESYDAPNHWWQYTTGGQFQTEDSMLDFVERLEDSTCTGICFTVDSMLVSHRERSIHNGLVRSWCSLGEIPRDEDGNLVYEAERAHLDNRGASGACFSNAHLGDRQATQRHDGPQDHAEGPDDRRGRREGCRGRGRYGGGLEPRRSAARPHGIHD